MQLMQLDTVTKTKRDEQLLQSRNNLEPVPCWVSCW